MLSSLYKAHAFRIRQNNAILAGIEALKQQNLIVISNQGKLMATAADLSTAVANLTTAVQALEAKESNAAPSVLQSDLDPILAGLNSLTTSIDALVNPPAPAT